MQGFLAFVVGFLAIIQSPEGVSMVDQLVAWLQGWF